MFLTNSEKTCSNSLKKNQQQFLQRRKKQVLLSRQLIENWSLELVYFVNILKLLETSFIVHVDNLIQIQQPFTNQGPLFLEKATRGQQ